MDSSKSEGNAEGTQEATSKTASSRRKGRRRSSRPRGLKYERRITKPDVDPLDVDAVRRRVGARLALVHDADYFALLGVPVNATGYDIRRAYLELRRTFEPNRLITGATMDLRGDAELIVEVLDEAYEILRDTRRRDRYRRAIEATRRV